MLRDVWCFTVPAGFGPWYDWHERERWTVAIVQTQWPVASWRLVARCIAPVRYDFDLRDPSYGSLFAARERARLFIAGRARAWKFEDVAHVHRDAERMSEIFQKSTDTLLNVPPNGYMYGDMNTAAIETALLRIASLREALATAETTTERVALTEDLEVAYARLESLGYYD